ncbi:Golgi pH regulator, partial [Termitomyces sp. J132]
LLCSLRWFSSIPLFLSCRKYLLRSLYSDLRNLSSDPASEVTPPTTPSTAQDIGIELNALPPPVSQGRSDKITPYLESKSFHSTVARSVFSIMFAESSMMFFVLMLQGLNIFLPSTRQLSWRFSLIFIISIILVVVPLAVSFLIAVGSKSASAKRSSFLLGPRILFSLIPVGLYLFVLSKIPLPSALATSDSFTSSLARLIVVGTVILGLLSGFGAVNHSWTYLPRFKQGEPTDKDIAVAEHTLHSVRNDLHDRRALAQQRANASDANSSWISRMINFRGDDLTQELRGLEALEYHMSTNVESLRVRKQAAIYSRTLRGRIINFGGLFFAIYCIVRILSCLIHVIDPLPRESSRSQTDLIADMLVNVLTFVTHPDSAAITSLARQLSLALVGLIILTSVRRVLRGATRALRVTSRNLGASLMMLLLAQLMGIYLLSTIVQLRNSFPPASDAEVNLFSTIPQFEVFGAVFDWSVLIAAGASAFVRWGSEKVSGLTE